MSYFIGAKLGIDGEAEFRAAINRSQESLQTLATEMKAVTSQYEKGDKSTENLTAQNKILNKQIEEQKNMLSELQKGLSIAIDKYGENDKITQTWRRSVNNATAKLNEMERQLRTNTATINNNEKATDNLGDEVDNLGKDIEETGKKTTVFGDVLKANLSSQAIIGGVKALASGVKNLTENAVESADETQKLADVYGLTAEKVQELRYAGTKLDVDLETILGAQSKLTKAMYEAKDGTGEQAAAFKALGISVVDANGNLRNAKDIMSEALDALNGYGNETERDALAMKIFGKSAMELNPLIKAGGTEFAKLTAEARKTGAVLSDETVEDIDKFGDNVDAMKLKIQASITKGLTPLIPKLQDIVDKVAEFNPEPLINGLGWIIDNSNTIISGIAGITAGLVAFKVGSWIDIGITAVVSSWRAYKTATEEATIAQWAMNAAQSASPVGIIAVGVGLVTAGLTAYALSADDAESETSKLNDEIEKTNRTVESNIKSREDNVKSIESEYGAVQKLSDTLYDLADKANKTSAEKSQMATLVEQLNKAIPNLNLSLNEETGILSKQRGEVNKLITANLEYYKVKAAEENLIKIASDIYSEENNLKKLEEEKTNLINKQTEAVKKLSEAQEKAKDDVFFGKYETVGFELDVLDINDAVNENGKAIESVKSKLSGLNDEYSRVLDYIKNNLIALDTIPDKVKESASAIKTLLSDLTDSVKEQLNNRQKALEESHNNAIEKIRDEYGVYEEAEKSKTEMLQEELSEKKTVIENILSLSKEAAKQEGEAFTESSKKILEEAQNVHNEKIAMYAQEYLAQVGAIDKRVAAEIQGYKDQISAIEKAQAEEDAALKEKQDREKLQSLQEKIDNAKDDEERRKAEAELQEEKDRQKREATEKQRQEQIKALNEQIKTATEKATQEKNDLLNILNERVEGEKKLIEDKTTYSIKKIQEERKAKEAAETAKYNATKQTLDNAEKALDEYLKKFKDKLSEESSSNVEAVAELAKLLNGTGIIVYSSGVIDSGTVRDSIQNEHYRINHGLQASAKVNTYNSGLSPVNADIGLPKNYQEALNAASKAISASVNIITAPAAVSQSGANTSVPSAGATPSTAVLSGADKADIVNAVVSRLKQFNIILDGDKVGRFAVDAVSREMYVQ